MFDIGAAWQSTIKRAKGNSFLLVILCLFFVTLAIFARTGNQALDTLMIFMFSVLAFIVVYVIIVLNIKKSKPPIKRRKKPKLPSAPIEKPFREKVKDAREVVKLIKDISDLDDS